MPTIAEKRTRFAELHASPGCFVIPNPFDIGSANTRLAWVPGARQHQRRHGLRCRKGRRRC